MTRNMAHGSGGEFGDRTLLLALHTEAAPSDEEWAAWVAFIDPIGQRLQQDLHRCPNLVITDGGAPSTAQRTTVNTLIAQAKSMPPVAVVTESLAVRTLLRGLAIFNPRVRAFAPTDLDGALAHLEQQPTRAERRAIVEACQRLEQEHRLNVRTLRAITG